MAQRLARAILQGDKTEHLSAVAEKRRSLAAIDCIQYLHNDRDTGAEVILRSRSQEFTTEK
jgi:hypothetical protein